LITERAAPVTGYLLPLDGRADLAAGSIAMIRCLDEEDIGQVDRRETIEAHSG
jgi:hypothetical protein